MKINNILVRNENCTWAACLPACLPRTHAHTHAPNTTHTHTHTEGEQLKSMTADELFTHSCNCLANQNAPWQRSRRLIHGSWKLHEVMDFRLKRQHVLYRHRHTHTDTQRHTHTDTHRHTHTDTQRHTHTPTHTDTHTRHSRHNPRIIYNQ